MVRSSKVVALQRVNPAFPQVERGPASGELLCTVSVRIDEEGLPTRIVREECLSPYFESVEEALMHWRWAPVRIGGEARPASFVFQTRFYAELPNGVVEATDQETVSTNAIATHQVLPAASGFCRVEATVSDQGSVRDVASSSLGCQALVTASPEVPKKLLKTDDAYACAATFVTKKQGAKSIVVAKNDCPGAYRRATKRLAQSWTWYDGDYEVVFTWSGEPSDEEKRAAAEAMLKLL